MSLRGTAAIIGFAALAQSAFAQDFSAHGYLDCRLIARADEIRHVRWEFKNPLAPGAMAIARFRAVLN